MTVMIFLASGFLPVPEGIAQERVFFEDRFDGELKPGWRWLRGNPECRRFVDDSLEIVAEPFAGNEAKNVLIRPVDFCGKGTFIVETQMTFFDKPTNQFQQGGIYWMRNGRVVFKLVHECVDGKLYIYPGKIPVDSPSVNLRLISNGDDIFAEYRDSGESSYRRIYEGKLDKGGNDEIALQCWNGPRDDDSGRTRFHLFRILQVED